MLLLFRWLSRAPLWLAHAVGGVLGWVAWGVSPTYRRRFHANSLLAGLTVAQRRAAVAEAGKMACELPRLWFGAPVPVHWRGVEHIEMALAQGRGLLFLTPHLGCFEVTAQAYAQRFGAQSVGGLPKKPVSVLFRPPRQAGWRQVVESARERPGLSTAPTTLAGVKQLMQALKNGESVGLLPDQVPPLGMGVWAPFWGQPAYTMTLWHRFARMPNTVTLLMTGERLPGGAGYVVHVTPLTQVLGAPVSDVPEVAATQLNQALEWMIRRFPEQYLWGYQRYKQPRKGL
jgi:Kdo2-lipid IVA lauroyltransferase/acyltransferase